MTSATLEKVTVNAGAEHLLARAVCLILSCGYLGNQRKIELGGVEMKLKAVDDADSTELTGEKDELKATKLLFATKDLKACSAAIASVKNRLRAMSVDGGLRLFGPGCYLLPLLAVDDAERVLTEGQALIAAKTEELIALLPRLLEQRREKLGDLFNEADYPSPDEIRAAYTIDWHYASFATPERLEEVSAAAYHRAKAQQDARMSNAYDDVITGMRQGAAVVMKELAARLRPDADGKPKRMMSSALNDVQDLFQRLPILNSIGQDEDLLGALARIGALTEGLDMEVVKKNGAIRDMLVAEAEKAAAALDVLIVKGKRAISFGDDDL